MKKTQFIEVRKNIRNTLFSYISVILFVMLGTCLFCGLGWSGKAVENSVENYFTESNMRDIEIVFPLGAKEQDIETVKGVEGVSEVEGLQEAYAYFELDGTILHAKIPMITQNVDKVFLVKGRLPQNNREIAITEPWSIESGVKIGDEITLIHDDGDGMKYLTNDKFTVTAIVESPNYLSKFSLTFGVDVETATPIDCLLFAHKDAFNFTKYGGYRSVLVNSNSLRAYPTTHDEYVFKSDALKDKILQAIASPNVAAVTRVSNAGFTGVNSTYSMFNKLRYSMAALFVVIGILVSYTSVSRIVFKQKILIGTKKALGLRTSEIVSGYVVYALSAVFIGATLGVLLARFLIEPIFLSIMIKNFSFHRIVHYFSVTETLIAFAIETVLILIAALLACTSVLRTGTVKLLNGADDKVYKPKFYEKTKLWNKLSLVTKSIINNFFKDKRRVVATLIGILGCTSLVVCGLTFYSGLDGALDKQFDKVQSFDTLIYYDQNVTNSTENISEALENNNLTYSKAYNTTGKTRYKNTVGITKLFIVDDNVDKVFNFYDMSGKKQEIGDKIWISCAFSIETGAGVGDTVIYIDATGRSYGLVVGGVYEYYLMRCQIMMSEKIFNDVFGASIGYNVFMVDRGDLSVNNLVKKVENIDGYIQTEDYYKTSNDIYTPIKSMGIAISIMYIVLSVVLALLVLLNLLVMFIEEKKRELTIMLINGFPLKTVRKYIYSDTILLSIIGIILGVVLGVGVCNLSLKALSSEVCHFLYGIHPIACLIGVAVTGAIIIIMSIVALKRIEKFKLTDVNK